MADYALRIYRKFPDRQLVQVVIYLRETSSRKVYETRFAANNFIHEFRVVRLWEEETEPFLESTGLLPYAALTNTDDREGVLREVARKLEDIDNRREQGNLMTIAAVMGALSLESDVIERIFRRDIMQASPMYHRLKAWAKEDAERELRLTVEQEIGESIALQKARSIALNFIRQGISLEMIAQATGLTIAQLQSLQAENQ
jgi:predicted transposase/invertase (TIGR01784 family)